MLDKVIMLTFSMFMIFLFAFISVTGVGMFTQWCQVQDEAQYIATSMGKWGGYTSQAAQSVQTFSQGINCPQSKITVQVSSAGPINFGGSLWARITVPFDFTVGEYKIGTYNITGLGKSVSSYLGGYNVTYISP
jgi:hypothetical protein